jgi:5-methylcytosine-specific restriction endonuclease McrA
MRRRPRLRRLDGARRTHRLVLLDGLSVFSASPLAASAFTTRNNTQIRAYHRWLGCAPVDTSGQRVGVPLSHQGYSRAGGSCDSLGKGGDATLENAQTTCQHCNPSKGVRDYPDQSSALVARSPASEHVKRNKSATRIVAKGLLRKRLQTAFHAPRPAKGRRPRRSHE